MAAKKGIAVPIYRIDILAAVEFFGGSVQVAELPALLVTHYNKMKGQETYRSEGSATVAGGHFELFRNIIAQPNTSAGVNFFKGSGIELAQISNQMQHLVCFLVVDEELYAYTAGQAAVVFERFVDISFPIEVGRRIAKPEVKGARSSQITGSTLASDVHFRDPRRLTYTESLENVWTALSGQLRDKVLDEQELTSVFGAKTKIRLDVTSAIKLGPRIESPEKLVELVRWFANKAVAKLPADDGWGALDAIKILNPRKKKDLIARLRLELAKKIFINNDYQNLAVAHVDASLYDNASNYVVSQGKDVIYEDASRPTLVDIVAAAQIDTTDLIANFSAIDIRTENDDYGAMFVTSGPLINHLHGELRHSGRTYFLLAGKWYEVDAVYIKQVTKDFLLIMEELDLDRAQVGLQPWNITDSEGTYNKTSVKAKTFINGDRVLTDNVELFDGLASDGTNTYIIHVKRDFDVKVRDVRSQVINSAQIIENDLRTDVHLKLKEHHGRLVSRGRTTLTEAQFLGLLEHPRVYVMAYGSKIKVSKQTLNNFGSCVARMEVVSMNNQFRQIGSTDSQAKLRVSWLELVDTT